MEDKEKIRQLADELIERSCVLTFASINADGYPRPVPVVKVAHEGIKTIYFSTGVDSEKTAHVKANPKAGISFIDKGDTASFTGTVEVLTDEASKKKYWVDHFVEHFPNGPTDPNYCVFKFTSVKADYWINNIFVKNDVL